MLPQISLDQSLDPLSDLARQILRFNSPAAYTKLVPAGSGSDEIRKVLKDVTPKQLLSVPIKDESEARCILSALYLWHDCLDESHTISQSISTATGSFWHAIMHRREGDFANSKYWYARCQNHPALPIIAAQVNTFVSTLPADKTILRITQSGFNPDAFVDFAQQSHTNPHTDQYRLAVSLQQIEWRCLFDYSVRQASG